MFRETEGVRAMPRRLWFFLLLYWGMCERGSDFKGLEVVWIVCFVDRLVAAATSAVMGYTMGICR